MATYWWRNAAADGDANNSANWDTAEAGGGSHAVPGSSDYAYFSSTASNSNCTLSAAFSCNRIYTGSAQTGGTDNYTGQIDANDFAFTIGERFWLLSACTILLGNATHTMYYPQFSTAVTLTAETSTLKVTNTIYSGQHTFYNLQFSGTAVGISNYGTYSNALTVDVGCTATLNGDASLTGSAGATTTIGGTLTSATVGTLSLNDTAGANLSTGGTLSAHVGFILTAGDATIPVRTYGGSVTVQSASASARTATLGAGSYTLSNALYLKANAPGKLTLDGATNDPTVGVGNGTTAIDFTGTGAGSEELLFGDGTWTCSGLVDFTGGTVTKAASTLVMAGSGKTLTANGQALNNVTCTDNTTFGDALDIDGILKCITQDKTLTFKSGVTHVINDFNLEGASGHPVVLQSDDLVPPETTWALNLAQAAAPTKISYVSVDYSDATASPAAVKADDGTNTDGGHNTKWTFAGGAAAPYRMRRFNPAVMAGSNPGFMLLGGG